MALDSLGEVLEKNAKTDDESTNQRENNFRLIKLSLPNNREGFFCRKHFLQKEIYRGRQTCSVRKNYTARQSPNQIHFSIYRITFGEGFMFELSFLIITAQLTDSYIRWLAFSDRVGEEIKRRLFKSYFLWGAASLFLYVAILSTFGISATTYKTIIMLGWLPYFLIGVHFIKIGLTRHVFVLGMSVIAALVQHTICALIILNLFDFQNDADIILTEAAGYLLLFAIFLPTFGRYFINLLPGREFFMRPIGIYLAILPLVIVSGHLIRLADDVLVHSSMERLSRIYLPIVFFFFYRYILISAKNFYEMQKSKRNKERLADQLNDLKEYNEQIREKQTKISVMRHDLRHNYNLIYALLESGEVDKAREHIRKQEEALRGRAIIKYADEP